MNKIGRAAVAALATAAAAVGVLTTTSADAATPAPVAGNTVAVPLTRVVDTPGIALANGATSTVQVAGRTFGSVTVPANATAIEGMLTAYLDTGVSRLTIETAGTGAPGTPTVIGSKTTAAQPSGAGEAFHVALSADGKVSVHNTGAQTHYLLAITGYDVPATTCQATVSNIPASTQPIALHNVGGTIVNADPTKGATDAGSVRLAAGTYDMRVLGNFIGLNNNDDSAFAGIQTFGTMVVWTGDTIAPDFGNVLATGGGVLIPKANSATLTIDPTDSLSQFVTLSAAADVHVGFFAYDDNSGSAGTTGQPGAGAVTAVIQSAVFRSVC
ncbi:MAG TPA: hypothetical protein VHV49_01240 [Pseudonocardiaceae bacterium]|jgi:hypothetical protein|nr:hypothetical protein [Pseudonocardiaceae bacterium]